MRRAVIFLTLFVVSVALAGCGGGSSKTKSTTTTTATSTSTSLPASVPKPNLGRIVPANYVVQKIQYAKLSGQATPDAVVVSKGPSSGDFGFHPAELQVISWDVIAERWNVIYDAQKDKEFQVQYGTNGSNQYITSPPDLETASTPILDRTADGDVEEIAFVRFGSEKKLDLVFSTTQNYGGSGSPGNLVVIGFDQGEANLRYLWFGDGGVGFDVSGLGAKQTLAASARFWTPVDAHCCPVREYSFVIGEDAEHSITSLSDDRPWLGLFVQAVEESASDSPLEVVDVLDGSLAASLFQQGDVITEIVGAKTSEDQGSLGPALIDQLALEKAGSRVTIRIDRGGVTKTVTVKLGSYIDSSAQNAEPPSDLSIMAI